MALFFLSADVEAGCALVEAWLASDATVDEAALAAARDGAHKESERANKQDSAIGGSPQWKERDAERLSLRRSGWLGCAVGNLCNAALKQPGWQNTAPVMDAASYALPGVSAQSLGQLRLRLLAEASSTAEPAPIARMKKRRGLPLHDVVACVGPDLAKHLKRLHARIDPEARTHQAGLRASLEAKGYRASAAVFAFDAVYGGLTVLDDDLPVLFGAYACLKSDAHGAPRGGRIDLVPVLFAPSDVIYFLDDEGGAWAQDTIEDEAAAPCATSGDTLVKQVLTKLTESQAGPAL